MAIPKEVKEQAQALVDRGDYTAAKRLVEEHKGSWPRDLIGDPIPRRFQPRVFAHSSTR